MAGIANSLRYRCGSQEPHGFDDFVDGFRPLFRNQWAYRGLTLAVVHMSEHYPALRTRYAARQRRRTDAFRSKLQHLGTVGSLSPSLGREDLERLVAMISLIGRFWISESRLDRNDEPIERTIDHYLGVLAGALLGSASAKGREELRRFLQGRDRRT